MKEFELKPGTHIHLVGIGGSGLSAIARVLIGKGYKVSGSDIQMNDLMDDLKMSGITIFEGHDPRSIQGADLLLISSAIPENNIEVVTAEASNVPILKRSEFLSEFLSEYFTIAIAGTHGKTTTTGMISQIMLEAGLDPSVVVGGSLPVLGGNGRAGQSEYFVIEADEYDQMFLGLKPNIAVITNVEYDHPDQYLSKKDYQEAFERFLYGVRTGGHLVICGDDSGAKKLAIDFDFLGIEIETYGLTTADWQALDLRSNQLGGSDFLIQKNGESIGLIRLRIPGEHNVLNALAAIATTSDLGVEFDTIRQALAEFGGVSRRFQVVGEVGDVTIIDDYAHHPTEIQATLAAARQRYSNRRIWAVWQPHTFSRTKSLLVEFATCFSKADRVLILDVYRSREKNTLGIDMNSVLKAMDHPNAHHAGNIRATADYLLDRVRPGDVILTLSAGDGNVIGNIVLEDLHQRVGKNTPENNGQSRISNSYGNE